MNTHMQYFELTPPIKWGSGHMTDAGGKRTETFFDCADCGARECEIAGILSSGPRFEQIGFLPTPGRNLPPRPAMFCAECFAARLTPKPVEPDPIENAIDEVEIQVTDGVFV